MTESVNVTFSVVWTNTNLGTATSLLVDGVVYLGGSVLVTPGDHDIIIVASEGSSANSAGTVEVTASYTYNGNDYAQKITKTFTTTPPNCPDGCITGG